MHPQLQLLHTPALHLADGRRLLLPANDAALLAVLALDGPTSREAMARLLWPDAHGEGARINLRQRLSRWKARAGLVLQQPGGSGMLALPPLPHAAPPGSAALSHDLHGLAERLAGDPAAGSGDLLGSHAYDDNPRLGEWLQHAREKWHRTRLEALAAIAERLERAHDIAEALAYACRIVQDDPLAEHAHRRVMRLHYLRGDRSAALAAYHGLCKLLRAELGTVASRETLDLARLIESSGATGPPPPAVPAQPPLALLRPPRMVGRDAEWQVLAQAWRAVRPVLLIGEPGIGKSRLVRDFAEAQGHALLARARPGDHREPYSTLARLLREAFTLFAALAGAAQGDAMPAWARADLARLVPALASGPATPRPGHAPAPPADATAGRLEPVRLRHALAAVLDHWRLLGARSLVIDDLQFADAASLELVLAWHHHHHHAAGTEPAAGQALRLLMTVRTQEPVPALAQWQAEQAADSAHAPVELRLGPLNGDAVAALIDSFALAELDAPHWAGPLHRHTGGNPLFIVHTLIAALNNRLGLLQGDGTRQAPDILPLPDQVAALIDQRLQRLGPDALGLARLAAIAGADFSAELAARVLETHPINLADPWAELEHHGVLRGQGFAHDLIGEVTLRSVPQAIARALHLRVAQALAGHGGAPARLAHHWLQAEQWRDAGAALSAAAALAFAESRRAEELAFLDQAAACLERCGDHAAAFQVRLRAVDAAVVVDPGASVTQRMQALLAGARDDSERLDARLAQSKQLLNDAAFAAARGPAAEAMALALRLGDPVRQVAAAGWHGLALAAGGQETAGLAVFESVAAQAARLAQRPDLQPPDLHQTAAHPPAAHLQIALDHFGAHGYALHQASRFQAALAPMRQAMALAEQAGDISEAMVQAVNLGLVRHRLGDRGASLAAFEQALGYWRRLDAPKGMSAAGLHLHLGSLHGDAGRYRDALAALTWALEQVRNGRAAAWATLVEHRLSALFVALGQPAQARQALTPLPDGASASDRLARLMALCRLAAPGDATTAAAEPLRQLAAFATNYPDDVPAMNRLSADLLLADLSPPAQALALCRDAHARALLLEASGMAMCATVRHADALRRLGDADGAAALAEAALADITHSANSANSGEHGFDGLQPGEFWWLAYSALQAGGRHAAARQALTTGAATVARIASDHVPAEFIDSFLNRNPFNRQLLAAAGSLMS